MSDHQITGKKVQVTAYAKADAGEYGWPTRHPGVPVLVRVVAPAAALRDRAPVDLVAVIDASSGAGGLPPASRQGLLEEAMKAIIGRLDDRDRLAIVPVQAPPELPQDGYNSLMAMNAAGRSTAANNVKLLAATGREKLSNALTTASKILQSREKKDNVGFVILISDGDDDSIITREKKLEFECSVHAFGFRDAHNVKAMHHVADAYNGTYGVLDDEHGRISDAFAASIAKITSVVAVDTHVQITCGGTGGGGEPSRAALSSIESGRRESAVADDRKSGVIKGGSLHAGAVRNFIFYVNNAGDHDGDGGDSLKDHFTVRFHYHHPSSTGSGSSTQEWADEQKHVVTRGVEGSRLVAAEIVRLEAVDIVDGIRRKYVEHGRPLAGDAADELRREWLRLRASKYGQEAREVCLLAELDAEMRDMEAAMRRCSGLSYMLSWHSCHTLQHQTRAVVAVPTTVAAAAGSQHVHTTQQGQAAPPQTPVPAKGGSSVAMAALQESFGRMASGADCGGGRKRKSHERYTELEMIERRLTYWSRVTCDLPPMVHSSAAAGDDCPDHITTVFQQASRESIERAMFHDVFLAVVHATGRRATGSQSSAEHSGGAASERRHPHDPCMG